MLSYVAMPKNGATKFAQFLLVHPLTRLEFCATFGGLRN